MSDTIKLAIISATSLLFFIGAFVLASKLFGPKKTEASQIKSKKPHKADVSAAPPAVYPSPQPVRYNSPKAALPDLQNFAHLTPNAAGSPAMPGPIEPPVPAPVVHPQAGKISYGSATEYVSVGANENAPSNLPLPADITAAPDNSHGALRITICGDNGAPEYFVNVSEHELPVTIGRGKSDARGKTITVSEPTVSFQHVKISIKNGVLSVCDCCSTCGTVINAEGGSSLVLKNDSKDSKTELYLRRFELVMGRMTAKVEVLEPFASGLHTGCRVTLSAAHNGAPTRQETFFSSFTIGRQDADLILPDPLVSRLHAVVCRTPDGRFVLCDNGSTNGIYDCRRGTQITEVELKKGTSLSLGDTQLTVECVERGLLPNQIPSNLPRTVYYDSVSGVQAQRFV